MLIRLWISYTWKVYPLSYHSMRIIMPECSEDQYKHKCIYSLMEMMNNYSRHLKKWLSIIKSMILSMRDSYSVIPTIKTIDNYGIYSISMNPLHNHN